MRTSSKKTESARPPCRVLALYGSPRRGGNTDLLLNEFVRGCASAGAAVEPLYLSQLRLKGCQGCNGCAEKGRCVVQDDMDKVYKALGECDRIVLASPIYFYGVTGQTKLVIDRAQALWSERIRAGKGKPVLSRKGFFISVGATRGKRLFDGAVLTVRYFFDAIGAQYCGNLLYTGFDEKGAIRRHPTAFQECFEAGAAFAS